MNLSELFIRRPVTTTLVMAGILIFGMMGYRLLPVSDLPNVDFPTIQVSASLPGASPETMASSVATPLERQFSTIAGLDNMNSTSTQGSTQITLQFNLTRNLDGAALDDVMESMPAIVENCFSSGVATAEAIVSGDAPGSVAETWIVGKSTFGRSLTGRSR